MGVTRGGVITYYHDVMSSILIICDQNRTTPEKNTKRSPNVVLMLAHRLRRWTNIKTTLVDRLVLNRTANVFHDRKMTNI